MDHDKFLQLVYDRFHAATAWPLVRDLQVELRPVNVRLVAAEIGTELIAYEEGPDGVCFLRLEGLARCPRARDDLETFLAAIRFIAKHFIDNGPAAITSETLAERLSLRSDALRRLGLILYRNTVCSSGGSWKLDGSVFTVNPSTDAWAFEDVKTLQDLFEIRKKMADEALAVASRLYQGPRGKGGRGSTDVQPQTEGPAPGHMRVFISWSGEGSHKLALILHDWLPLVMQAVHPYVSSESIQKGTRWPIDLANELEKTAFGILCMVPSNADAPWLNFEAGALSKMVKESRVVPLLFGLEPSALVGHPLGQFQAAEFKKDEIFKTLQSINDLLGPARLSEERLRKAFEHAWPTLARDVEAETASDRPGTPVPVPARVRSESSSELSDTERQILAMWADQATDFSLLATHVAGVLHISEQKATFYLDELEKKKYLHALYAMGQPARYQIIHKGREFLIQNGLS